MTHSTTKRTFTNDLIFPASGCGRHARRSLYGLPRFEALTASEQKHQLRHDGGEDEPKVRKWRRQHAQLPPEPYFDPVKTSGNITLIEGQTAMLECVVRHVGNKSVSG